MSRCVSSDSRFPCYEDGRQASHASGWRVNDDGSWSAYYGPHRDGGVADTVEHAQAIAKEWIERARWRWGG